MKLLGSKRLAGLMLAAAVAGAPLAALAQTPAPAPAAPAAAPAAEAAPAAAPEAAAPAAAPAPEAAAPAAPAQKVDKGDTTWMLISSVLVLLMIVPGLALFYGGLV